VSSKLLSRVLGIGLVGLVVLSGSTVVLKDTATTKKVISRKTLKPGVTLVHSRITVRGVFGAQEVYKLSWKFGNQHVSLHSSLLGAYDDSSTWITDHQISHLASAGGPPGMIAAMTGDYSIYQSWSPTRSTTSGILVQDRRIFRLGTGSLAVGYKPNGRFIMGHPILRPMKLELTGGTSATVGAFNPSPAALATSIRSDQVAAYTHAGNTVTIPANAVGVVLDSDVLATQLRGRRDNYKNVKGLDKSETVVAFRLTESTAQRQPVSMPLATPSTCATNVCQPAEQVTVPVSGVLILARTDTVTHVAADGLNHPADDV